MNDILSALLVFLAITLFFGIIAFISYIADEQEHRHKLELEKAKQGIFDKTTNKNSLESYLERILISVVIFAVVVLICYALNVPSDFLEYVLSLITQKPN